MKAEQYFICKEFPQIFCAVAMKRVGKGPQRQNEHLRPVIDPEKEEIPDECPDWWTEGKTGVDNEP